MTYTLRAIPSLLVCSYFLTACVGGNGGDENDLPPPPSEPGVYIDTASVVEGDSGETSLIFKVTLNTKLDGPVTFNWTTANGSADQSDFRADDGSLTIEAGKTSVTGEVTVFGDLEPEFTESFDIILSELDNQSSKTVVFGQTTGKALILNDDGTYLDTQPLNDTGMLACETSNSDNPTKCSDKAAYTNQDAHYGRDNEALNGTLYKVGAGWAGFDFTKLDAKGEALDNNAGNWRCVRDNRTGLIWEVKTTDKGLQDRFNTYSWYFDSDRLLTGSNNGTPNGGECKGNIACDTQSYIDAINKAGLCGRTSEWRLPAPEELRSINDYRRGYSTRPTLDTNFFKNDPAILESSLYSTGVWSLMSYYPISGDQSLDRAIGYNYQSGSAVSAQKSTNGDNKFDQLYIRLVNGS
ncbi:MAG: DUF1566 domain-containing protein [Gammaproteobacteria bacterium]|nr:DUF1566 domain-containing protein [Gammaproteobacteria bacterium]